MFPATTHALSVSGTSEAISPNRAQSVRAPVVASHRDYVRRRDQLAIADKPGRRGLRAASVRADLGRRPIGLGVAAAALVAPARAAAARSLPIPAARTAGEM